MTLNLSISFQLQFALSKKEYLNHITSESHNLSIARYKNEQENLFKSNNGVSLVSSTPTTTNTAVAARPVADVFNGTERKDVNNKKGATSHSADRNNNLQRQKNQQSCGNNNHFNNRMPNNHFGSLNAGISNGPMKTLPGNMRNDNNNGKNSNATRNTGAVSKNGNFNRNSGRNNGQPEKQSQNASTNAGNCVISDLIDFTDDRNTSTKQGDQITSTPIEIKAALPPVKLPNVFDEDIFSFIEAQQKPVVAQQQANKTKANPRTESSSTINATAGSSQGADIKAVPPYMMNSLYLAYDKKQKVKHTQQPINQRPQINRSGEQGQQQQRRDQKNQNNSAQETSTSSSATNSNLFESKLNKLFEEINKQKPLEEIRAASQKILGDDSRTETQSLIGNDSRGQRHGMESALRQRSASTLSLNRGEGQNNRNTGATPRRNLNNSNASGGSRRSPNVKPTIDSK